MSKEQEELVEKVKALMARKYGGSLVTATQNGDDYFTSAQMESALKCSDWTFLLRQKPESIEMLDRKGRLSMDEPKKRLLNSLRTEAGVFSEVYISSPVGEGVARNILDPATHLLFLESGEVDILYELRGGRKVAVDTAVAGDRVRLAAGLYGIPRGRRRERIEALLLTSDRPIPESRLAEILGIAHLLERVGAPARAGGKG